jgi:SAM-dependent methyltransferase
MAAARRELRVGLSAALLALAGFALTTGGCTQRPAAPPVPMATPRLDVIWVASDAAVVMEMLRVAEVGRTDVVYDLGCGDGRIVIAAAQRFGARAVGVDLDAELLRQARQDAVKAGVAERVTFRQQNLFTTDLGEATVVTLYLSPEVNLRLRPKLLRELRPSSRIVSHEYDLGDWLPERTVLVSRTARAHRIFLWHVPPLPKGSR